MGPGKNWISVKLIDWEISSFEVGRYSVGKLEELQSESDREMK